MATSATKQCELKKQRLVEKYRPQRDALKKRLTQLRAMLDVENEDVESIYVEMEGLQAKLDALPRNSKPTRLRNRCRLTGRPRGYYRRFGLSRNMLRLYAMMGLIPGIRKSSW